MPTTYYYAGCVFASKEWEKRFRSYANYLQYVCNRYNIIYYVCIHPASTYYTYIFIIYMHVCAAKTRRLVWNNTRVITTRAAYGRAYRRDYSGRVCWTFLEKKKIISHKQTPPCLWYYVYKSIKICGYGSNRVATPRSSGANCLKERRQRVIDTHTHIMII